MRCDLNRFKVSSLPDDHQKPQLFFFKPPKTKYHAWFHRKASFLFKQIRNDITFFEVCREALKKAFSVFHKLCFGLGEAISPRAPSVPCLAPTYPDGRTWFLCCFSSTASISCLSVVFYNWRDRYFRGLEWKIPSFFLWKRNQLLCSSLLSLAQLFAHSVFQLSLFFPVSWSICIRNQLHQMWL